MADFMTVTLVGGVAEDPELVVTSTGKSLLKIKLRTSRSTKNTAGEWEQKEATTWTVTAWGDLAENAAEAISKGDIIIALGTISQREWEGKDGNKRISLEMNAQHIGRSLKSSPQKEAFAPAAPEMKGFDEMVEEPPF